jgi:hypothetical protein
MVQKAKGFFSIKWIWIIIIYAAILRFSFLDSQPLWIDEQISASVMQSILSSGMPILPSGSFYGRAMIFHYASALFSLPFSFLGLYAFRIFSIVIGIAFVYVIFLIGREISNKYLPWIMALLSCFFSVFILYSQQSRFYIFLMFMIALEILFVLRKKRIPATIAFLIALETHPQALFFIIPLLASWLKWLSERRIRHKKLIMSLIIVAALLLVARSLSSLIGSISFDYFWMHLLRAFNFLMDNMRYSLYFALAGIVFILFKNKRLFLYLYLPSLISFFGVLLLDRFETRYLFILFFPLMLSFGYLFDWLAKRLDARIILIGLGLFVFLSSNVFDPLVAPYTLYPKPVYNLDRTMPKMDYERLFSEVELKNITLVSGWGLGPYLYGHEPDYSIPFSMTGQASSSTFQNGSERYIGVPAFPQGFEGEYYLLLDRYARSKLRRNPIEENCSLEYDSLGLMLFYCS